MPVWIAFVPRAESGIGFHHLRIRVLLEPAAPVNDRGGDYCQAHAICTRGTGNRPELQLAPQALSSPTRTTVVHEQVRVVQQTADAERHYLVTDTSVENHYTVAQGAVGYGDGPPAQGVVDHLMPVDDPQWVCPTLTFDCHPDDAIGRNEVLASPGPVPLRDLASENGRRIDQGRDSILGKACGYDLFRRDQAGGKVKAVRSDVPAIADGPRTPCPDNRPHPPDQHTRGQNNCRKNDPSTGTQQQHEPV